MTAGSDEILASAHKRAEDGGLPYFGTLPPAEAQALLTRTPQAHLVDVRTRAEWDYVGHVPHSALVEWNTYPDGTRNPHFLEELRRVAPDPQAPVMFLCRSGQRSDSAARVAAAAGYSMAINVLEGFEGDKDGSGQRGNIGGWRKNGLPWVQG